MTPHEIHMALRRRLRESAAVRDDSAAWDNVEFKRTPGRSYLEETFKVERKRRVLFASSAQVEWAGRYFIEWFGPSGKGTDGIAADVADILSLFSLAWGVTFSPGETLRVDGANEPIPGEIEPASAGFASCMITIPWTARGYERSAAA